MIMRKEVDMGDSNWNDTSEIKIWVYAMFDC